MLRVDGIAATRLLGQFEGGGPAVIVATTFENDDYVYDALQAGARGFRSNDLPRKITSTPSASCTTVSRCSSPLPFAG